MQRCFFKITLPVSRYDMIWYKAVSQSIHITFMFVFYCGYTNSCFCSCLYNIDIRCNMSAHFDSGPRSTFLYGQTSSKFIYFYVSLLRFCYFLGGNRTQHDVLSFFINITSNEILNMFLISNCKQCMISHAGMRGSRMSKAPQNTARKNSIKSIKYMN
jgi:hypothetical protein